MHVLFVHKNFPAQFGQVADFLIRRHDYRCTFVTERPVLQSGAIECVQYRCRGGATDKNHFCSRSFENAIWHADAVGEALQARPDIQPDLIVGHSGFGSTLFLKDIYRCPIINYFEYFYRPVESDMDFRPDFPITDLDRARCRARNAMILLDLDNCELGYSPTEWQRSRLPQNWHSKVRTVFDGIDTQLWRPRCAAARQCAGQTIPQDVRIVTYVARGLESMRGFDIFMQVAKRICVERKDVLFVVVGEDRVCYGGDEKVTGGKSFKEWVLAQDNYDLSRFRFTGLIPTSALAELLALTDLHLYFTAPFVLSWSLMDALACGATVLASNTAPVREMVKHGENGLLANFFDVDGFAAQALEVLSAPREFKALGREGTARIEARYSMKVCLPQMVELFEDALVRR